jgi:hypothetical protein
MARVLVVSFSDLGRDPRVNRQIEALEGRHTIVAAGLAPPRHVVEEFIDISTPPLRTLGRVLTLGRLIVRRYDDVYWKRPGRMAALHRLRRVPVDVVLANDLDALPIALRLGPPVVFDAHEHSPTQGGDRASWRVLIGPYASWQVRRYIPRVAAMMTVGVGIAEAYTLETGVTAAVVTNAPPRHNLIPTSVHDPVRILHHGSAARGRGLEEMVQLAGLLDERFTVDFVLVGGPPGYREELERLAARNPRIRFPDPVPMPNIVAMANEYDIGLYVLQPTNFNRRYALPNKLFEFIQARLAVAIGPSPEMARIVRQYHCGIVADDFEPQTLASALNALDRREIAMLKRASHVAAAELCAESNEATIEEVVEAALERPGPHARR